ncbi:hypothetical protein [Mycoplasmopsis cynos]|uniref:hypothetical protein n=1 Tax=Mycoplasmopsis cynos TaxID=171284 RepID=UPI0024C6D16B|nr:hypothetical protein [Mycoplasmopsis cynos]WAM07877.1 hypothetical protein ONA21_00640 [Mycoplasmopsis cynos]
MNSPPCSGVFSGVLGASGAGFPGVFSSSFGFDEFPWSFDSGFSCSGVIEFPWLLFWSIPSALESLVLTFY